MLKLSKLLFLSLSFVLVLAACGSNGSEESGNVSVQTLEDLAAELESDVTESNEEEPAEEEFVEEESFELSPEDYAGSPLEDLIATFQQIITTVETPQVEEDFDGDGILDIAVVLEDTEIQEGYDELRRTLLVAFGYGDGTYHFPDYFDNIVLGANDGGVMGDPFMGLSYDEEYGMLGISHYGGSNYRWSNTYHIKYIEQGWSIVGYSSELFNVNDMSSEIMEFDLSMGEIYYEVVDSEGKSEMYFPTVPVQSEILLRDFNSDDFNEWISQITSNAILQ